MTVDLEVRPIKIIHAKEWCLKWHISYIIGIKSLLFHSILASSWTRMFIKRHSKRKFPRMEKCDLIQIFKISSWGENRGRLETRQDKTTQHNTTQHNTLHYTTKHDTTHYTTQQNTTQNTTLRNITKHDTTQHTTLHYTTDQDTTEHDTTHTTLHNRTWHNTLHYTNTTLHDTTQYYTASQPRRPRLESLKILLLRNRRYSTEEGNFCGEYGNALEINPTTSV